MVLTGYMGVEGIQSSVSIVLLLFSLIFFKNICHSLSAFTVVSDVLISLCMTYTFVGRDVGSSHCSTRGVKSTLGRQIAALSCLLDNNLSVCSPSGLSTRCV